MTAKILPFPVDLQMMLRDDILKAVRSWPQEERERATNGDAAVLLAKALVKAGWRKVK